MTDILGDRLPVGTFEDRADAGRRLAGALLHLKQDRPIVLALPRGGVPVAFEVASALGAPLDVVLVRKIGAPGHKELGLGAVVDGAHPHIVLNDDIVRAVQPDEGYIGPKRRGRSRRSSAAVLSTGRAARRWRWRGAR